MNSEQGLIAQYKKFALWARPNFTLTKTSFRSERLYAITYNKEKRI